LSDGRARTAHSATAERGAANVTEARPGRDETATALCPAHDATPATPELQPDPTTAAAAEGPADRVHGHQGWEAVGLCHRSRGKRRDPADKEPRGRGLATGVVTGRLEDRLHEHEGRQPADLRDEHRREQPAP